MSTKTENLRQSLRQQLKTIRERRAAVIEASTKRQLELLDEEERDVNEALASVDRVESQARHTIPPSAEETDLWERIKDLMTQEASIRQQTQVPEKYIRVDAVEHFAGDLADRVKAFEESSAGLKFSQSHGPRVREKRRELDAELATFEKTIRPACVLGAKLARIKEQIRTLSEQRDALKAEREAKALASVK